MQRVSAVAIFCEDIRGELSGQDTIVGTLPDNLGALPPPQAPPVGAAPMLPRLGIYLRVNLDREQGPPNELRVKLINTNGEMIPMQGWSEDVVRKGFSDAKENEAAIVGLILKVVASPFVIYRAGKVNIIVTVDGVEYVAGQLNISIPSSAISSAPPAVQSASGAPPLS
jgi:hypothetical protein